jgi:tripartite ATP-independent transporter DctP family solute receptor
MGTHITRRTLLHGCASAAALIATPGILRAQARYRPEYKLSCVGNRPLGTTEAAYRWAELVAAQTQGRINIKIYPGSQLVGGDQTRELVAMRQGLIDMLVSSTINIALQIREMNLFSLPFLMPDSAAFDALVTGAVRSDLDAALAKQGGVALAWSENGFRQISNSKRSVRKPEDLVGLKIRFAAGPIFSEIFNKLGANPLQMSWADLQPALATGAVDGQETPVNVFLQTRLDALSQRYLSLWNYVADANVCHVSKPVWDTFTADDQAIMRSAAEQAAREHTASTRKGLGGNGDRSSLDELARRNVHVEELSEAEKRAFGEVTKPVFEKWAGQTGTELVEKASKAIARRNA